MNELVLLYFNHEFISWGLPWGMVITGHRETWGISGNSSCMQCAEIR